MNWSFYDPKTGRFDARTFTGSAKLARLNARGKVPIEGRYDHRSQRVDVDSGAVVSYERPAAEVDAEQQAARDRSARRRIRELEAQQARRVRELLADSDPRLKAIDDEIVELRGVLSKSES